MLCSKTPMPCLRQWIETVVLVRSLMPFTVPLVGGFDGVDIVVHIFNPEKRKFYELEKIWSELIPKERVII